MKTKKQYTTPTLKVVAFKVEEGFQSIQYSMSLQSTSTPPAESDFNSQNQERWGTGQDVFGGNDWIW